MFLKDIIPEKELGKYLESIILDEGGDETGKFYTPLLVRETLPITRRLFEENILLAREFNIPQIMEKEKHLLIYGEAGSGKTATLKWLASSYAMRCLEKKESAVPIYVDLNSYVKGSFYDYVRKKAEKKGMSETCFRKLLNEKALFLLDGIDLLSPSSNFHPFEEISDFISEYEDCRYLITSRPGNFARIKSTFGAAELEKLTDEDILEFIGIYVKDRQKAETLKSRVLKETRSKPFIRNPQSLYLWLKVADALKGPVEKEIKVPSCRTEIYSAFISELLEGLKRKESFLNSGKQPEKKEPKAEVEIEAKTAVRPETKWETEIEAKPEVKRKTETETKQEMGKEIENEAVLERNNATKKYEDFLIELAFKLQCGNRTSCGYLYTLDLAEKYATDGYSGRRGTRDFVQTCILAGLLRKNSTEITIGINRSFQEYFTALKLKADFENGKDISETFRHPSWENSVVLVSELVRSADELVNSIILSGNLWLASKCCLKAGNETREKLCSLLAGKLESAFTEEKLKTIRALENFGNCGIKTASGALHDEEAIVRREAVKMLGGVKSEAALPTLAGALGDEDYSVRKEAVKSLGKLGSERAVDLLTKAFDDENRVVRLEAAEALAQVESDKSFEILVKALTSDDDFVRLGAVGALGRAKAGKAADSLIKAFQEGDNFLRLGAAEALGRMKSEKAIVIFKEALEDEDKLVRWMAAKALGEIESEEAHELLISTLADENHYVRREAAKSLGMINTESEKALDSLISALTDEAESVRKEAAEALGQLGAEKAVEPLISLLTDNDQAVRLGAARALGMIECERAVDPLLSALGDESRFVRKGAAKSLGKLESEKTLEPLICAFESGDNFVRREAIKVLSRIKTAGSLYKKPVSMSGMTTETLLEALDSDWGYEETAKGKRKNNGKQLSKETSNRILDTLINALKDEDEFVRREAANALGNISGKKSRNKFENKFENEYAGKTGNKVENKRENEYENKTGNEQGNDSGSKLESESGNKQENEFEIEYEKENEKALQPLVSALEDEDEEVRRLASEALGNLGSEKALYALINALNSEDRMVRRLASEALGRTRSEKAVKPLIALTLNDNVDFVRREAARALGKIKSEKAIGPLITALKDENNGGRWGAAEALGRIKAKEAVDPLINSLYDYDDFTRWASARALGRIKPKKAIVPLIDMLYDWNRFVKAEAAGSLSEICTKEDEALLKVLLVSENKFTANLAFEILEGIETRERVQASLFKK